MTMLTLDEWLKQVPDCARVGQHFYNCCFKSLHPSSVLHKNMDRLYNTTDEKLAVKIIDKIMKDYQWTHLPVLEN